jgi:hypothetical protein
VHSPDAAFGKRSRVRKRYKRIVNVNFTKDGQEGEKSHQKRNIERTAYRGSMFVSY